MAGGMIRCWETRVHYFRGSSVSELATESENQVSLEGEISSFSSLS